MYEDDDSYDPIADLAEREHKQRLKLSATYIILICIFGAFFAVGAAFVGWKVVTHNDKKKQNKITP